MLLGLGLGLGCPSEDKVERELREADWCESASDCVYVETGCQFDCWAPINKAERDRIERLLKRYHRRHSEECDAYCGEAPGYIKCDFGQCVIVDIFVDPTI